MYQALYRQYRPQTFEEILGQNHITTTLANQIQKGSIGHAYLFSGTRGTGKTSAAKIFSRAVNCLSPVNGSPCNQCEICKGIIDESIMDIMEMDAASNNSVEDIRELRDKVRYPPSRTRYKVYIIDEVHMLSKGAFNALLKTLEEPPKHLIFILATTEPERLPQTILSRCQRFDFRRISIKDIMENMKSIGERLDIEIDNKVLNLIARNSDGAMRDALSLLDQCISFNEGKITYEDAINILGIANRDIVFKLVEDIKAKDLESSLLTVDEIIQQGKDIHQFIKDLINHFRDLLIVKTSQNPVEIMQVDDESINSYREQSEGMSLEFILKSLDILSNSENQSKWSTQPRIILEMAIIKLANLGDEISLEERIRNLELALESGEIIKNKEIEKPAKMNIAKTERIKEQLKEEKSVVPMDKEIKEQVLDQDIELDFKTIKDNWQKVLQIIKTQKMNIFALLMEGEPVGYGNNVLTVNYKEGYGFHKDAVSGTNNKEFIEEIVSKFFKQDIEMRFLMEDELIIPQEKSTDSINKTIEDVIDFFGSDIVDIE